MDDFDLSQEMFESMGRMIQSMEKEREKLKRGRRIAEEIGLRSKDLGVDEFYTSDDIHRLLGEGVTVFDHASRRNTWTKDVGLRETFAEMRSAILISIRPITQESEERKLLGEFIEASLEHYTIKESLIERAKALLAKEPK